MTYLFAFVAGFIYDLPISYFALGFIALLLDALGVGTINNNRKQ